AGGKSRDGRAAEGLAEQVGHRFHWQQARDALQGMGDPALPTLVLYAEQAISPQVRAHAWHVLGFTAPKDRLKDLQALAAKEKQPLVQQTAQAALKQIGSR